MFAIDRDQSAFKAANSVLEKYGPNVIREKKKKLKYVILVSDSRVDLFLFMEILATWWRY